MFHPPAPPPPPQESQHQGNLQQQNHQLNQQQQQQPNQPNQPQQQPNVISAFPDPPSQYLSLFSDEHIAKGMAPLPPKPVSDGSYSMFGSVMTVDDSIIRPLEAQGIRRLYPRDFDHKKELKKMNHSILVNFLDLLDILVRCPDTQKREEKSADINMLFIQMHHLINELRPHQARETIRVTLQCQKRQRLATAIRMNQQIEKVTDAIGNHLTTIPDSLLELKANISQDIERLRQLCLNDLQDEVEVDSSLEDLVQLDSIMCNIVGSI